MFLSQVLNAIPMLLHIPGLPDKAFPKLNSFIALVNKMLIEHDSTWDPAQPPRDLTDAFLAEVEKVNGSSKKSGQGLCTEVL